MKKIILISLITFFAPQVHAFEDYIVTTDGKLTQISIENNQIIDVFPLITVMNEKNTLIIHPLKEGMTAFTVKKDGTEKFLFNVNVTEDETEVSSNDGFEVLPIDEPPLILDYTIDKPPILKKTAEPVNIDGVAVDTNKVIEESD